jgi:hypothetical protein
MATGTAQQPTIKNKKPAMAGPALGQPQIDPGGGTGVPAPTTPTPTGLGDPGGGTGVPAPTSTPVPPPSGTGDPGGGVAPASAPAVPAPTTAPAGTLTQQAAAAKAVEAFKAKNGGRAPTPEEWNELTRRAQALGWTSGNVSQSIVDQVIASIGGPPPGTPPPPPSTQQVQGQANSRLSELLGLSWGEVDPNSQAIQQPMQAFRAASERAADRQRMQNAIRNQARGVAETSGAGEAQLQQVLENQGINESSYEANLYAQELSTQREALQNAIQLATQAGLQDKARELQQKLGMLDIELRRLLGQGQLALGQASLEQNDKQFLERMGFNYAQLQGMLNNQAIQTILNGL